MVIKKNRPVSIRIFSLLFFCVILISGGVTEVSAQGTPPSATTTSDRTSPTPQILTATASIITSSCPPAPTAANVAHVFSENQLTEAVKSTDKAVIVSHGMEARTQFEYVIVARYSEAVPVFVSKKRKLNNLSKEQIIQILKGEITNWSQVGDAEGPIVLYLHSGVYQKKSFEKFLETIGLSPNDVKALNVRYSEDYRDLESIAGKDDNALVFGLRELEPNGLKTIKIDNISVLDTERLSEYPFDIPVILYKGKTSEANKVAEKVIKRIDKNNPLDEAVAGRMYHKPPPP